MDQRRADAYPSHERHAYEALSDEVRDDADCDERRGVAKIKAARGRRLGGYREPFGRRCAQQVSDAAYEGAVGGAGGLGSARSGSRSAAPAERRSIEDRIAALVAKHGTPP